MSRKFKSQASSGRVVPGGFGVFGSSGFGAAQSSPLSYIQEPPDYSAISDSNVVVAFKNLSKKDSTTKAKALEDIQTYVASPEQQAPEEGLIEAWVKLYPRLSIDSARRVRQLAHHINGSICSKCGKRAARHLPRIASPWLAGSYDSDRAAAKAAQDALNLVFPKDKVLGLKKTFQGAIVEYCRDAILHETIKTLSDERAVSADDAEATYARVQATSLAVLANLLGELGVEVEKQKQVYEELFSDAKFWELACYPDTAVRRSMHRLVLAALHKLPELAQTNLKAVSAAYVYKGLPSDQTGSANDYVTTLCALSKQFPSIWTVEYSGKKPPSSRLKQFLKHGSRSGSNEFWVAARSLFLILPAEILPKTFEDAKDLAFVARDGVGSKEERFNASAAWPAYYALLFVLAQALSAGDQEKLLESCAMPIVRQYLLPSPETAGWAIHGGRTAPLVAEAARVKGMDSMLEQEWPQLNEQLLQLAKMSQPQQSKEFEKSQSSVASAGQRYAALQQQLYSGGLSSSLGRMILESDVKIVAECGQLLQSREGKPFGAAAIVAELVRQCGSQLLTDEHFKTAVQKLLQHGDCAWITWSSFNHLIPCLYATESESFFSELLRCALGKVLALEPDQAASHIRALFPPNVLDGAVQLGKNHAELQGFILRSARPEIGSAQRDMILELHAVGALSDETAEKAFSSLIKALADVNNDAVKESSVLEMFVGMNDKTLRSLVSMPNGDQLLPNLLRLESHEDDTLAHQAADVSARLSSATAGHTAAEGRFSIIRQNLENVSSKSLSLDALLDLTGRLLGPERKVSSAEEILPDLDVWKSSLRAVMRPPKVSLALLSPLGGAVQLVMASPEQPIIRMDAEGLSQALRTAMYVSRLLLETGLKLQVDKTEQKWLVVGLLYTTVLVAEDNMSIPGTNALWHPSGGTAVEATVLDFISEVNGLLAKYWNETVPKLDIEGETSDYQSLMAALGPEDLHGAQSPAAYYGALAYAKVISNLFELHGHNSEQSSTSEQIFKTARKNTMTALSRLVGLQQPLADTPTLKRFCNELVANLTDMQSIEGSMAELLQLNAILQTGEALLAGIAKQRLIFLFKRLVAALQESANPSGTAEVYKALVLLLPGVQDMYGEHWSQVISAMINSWTPASVDSGDSAVDEDHISLTHATLKLYATLQKLSRSEDPNDDLLDALKDNHDAISQGLVTLLKSAHGASDEAHQPLLITHELLARQITQLPYQPLEDADELYPLLYTQSRPIQQGAFGLLHEQIPATQEQISFDAALENKTAQLPDELLSLILEAPTLDSLVDAPFDRNMPLPLQGYLYSWRLLFDHFTNSSYRVKTDYIEQLKDGSYLAGLLSFTFDFLGHSRGKPVDASKFDIPNYVADTEPSPERDVQWLLTHLYYLCLTHLPSLVKSYYLDIRSRQTSLAVESWTGKYISPLIVTASLQAVAEWSEKSVKEDPEYEKMAVKVGMRSKEINVSYVVDEQTMAIKVVLPEAYPLASAQVVGVSRVAVKEEKWQSWLRNCQGVITFSNGSITDGLAAWRKNVTGALKGQTECAICYSIIDSQKQLPTKRCPTCKNLFHSSCLFKWFKTSNASTCPLCRNAFNFN